MQHLLKSRKRCGRRTGYIYAAVLMTTLIVSTMGLCAISAAMMRLRIASDSNDWAAANVLAQSAVEDGALQLSSNNNWRTERTNGVESSALSLGRGTYTWKLVDDDGNLADDDSDSVRLVGIGRVGKVVAAQSVRLIPTGNALTCLESAFHCQGDVTVTSLVTWTTNQQISSNGNIAATGLLASVAGNAEAVGTVSGSVTGTKKNNANARRIPGSSVFDYYLDNGTPILVTTLPLSNSAYTIEKQVLSAQLNPYGDRNSEGIYVIDCQGLQVRIKDSRILGTIVLLNPAASSSLEGSLSWQTAVQNYPALLVSGNIDVKTMQTDLSESSLSKNFNPVGAPSQGIEDSDQTDVYPAEINGLVYVSGKFNAAPDLGESYFRGVTACATSAGTSPCRFNYREIFLDYPPPGFSSGNPMVISPGSQRRETLP